MAKKGGVGIKSAHGTLIQKAFRGKRQKGKSTGFGGLQAPTNTLFHKAVNIPKKGKFTLKGHTNTVFHDAINKPKKGKYGLIATQSSTFQKALRKRGK